MEQLQEERRGKYPCIIRTRVSLEQHEKIKEAAEIAGMRLSSYARHRLAGAHVSSKMDLQTLHEIRRQGGLLKMLAMQGVDTRDALEEVMKTMRALQAHVRANKG